MPFKIETKTFRFSMPIALGKVLPVKKWFWNKGNYKFLSPEERQELKQTLNLDEYKNLLQDQQKNKQPETMLLEWLKSKGFIKL